MIRYFKSKELLTLRVVSLLILLPSTVPANKNNSLPVNPSSSNSTDENGYIVYCPCMGRFGNQADQFLGALAFAKIVNRTLILPPWVEYIRHEVGSVQVPFDKYFKPEKVALYHRVITMERFMENLAPIIWPVDKRISFCSMDRGGKGASGCNAKDGNPFGPFWDKFKIDFVGSAIFGPDLQYTKINLSPSGKTDWEQKYPGNKWPVLAFVGPPSAFPVEEKYVHLQEYLEWQDEIKLKAEKMIKSLGKGPFIGIHMRNGADWSRVCEHVDSSQQLFSSPQCLGYRNEHGSLTHSMCFPPTSLIINQLVKAVQKISKKSSKTPSIFVASDRNHLLSEISTALKKMEMNVLVTKLDADDPHLDLAILSKADLFIGNCISSFTSFVKRSRDVNGGISEFWGFPDDNFNHTKSALKDEL